MFVVFPLSPAIYHCQSQISLSLSFLLGSPLPLSLVCLSIIVITLHSFLYLARALLAHSNDDLLVVSVDSDVVTTVRCL